MLKQETHVQHFTKIYETNEWVGSGSGSFPQNTVSYREYLINFIRKNNIKNVIDFGCGDWQFSRLMDWTGINYTGIDCVKMLIDNHNKIHATSNIKFEHIDNLDNFFAYKSELLILKDVIQHWLNTEIVYFLDNVINNFDYILITNSCDQKYDWQDEPIRSRPLSCDFFPLKKYNIKKRAHITTQDGNKEISLITKV